MPSDLNFMALSSLDELPELEPFIATCNGLAAQIHEVDQHIPLGAERYAATWRAFASSTVYGQQTVEDPAVTAARDTLAQLRAERTRLVELAVVARAALEGATAELRTTLLPQMAAQLGPPLNTLIHALEAALATERLNGPQGAHHGQARVLTTLLLAYLQAARGALEEEE
jgi:hypothetical protein